MPQEREHPSNQGSPFEPEKEIEELCSLLSSGFETKEERTVRNAQLRDKLKSVSNTALVHTHWHNQLIHQELVRRLESDVSFTLNDLCEASARLALTGVRKSGRKFYESVLKKVQVHTPNAPREEVVGIINQYTRTQMDDGIDILDHIASFREDLDDILSSVVDLARDQGVEHQNTMRDDMYWLKQRATMIRDIRKNAE